MTTDLMQDLLESIRMHRSTLESPDVAHLVINSNDVVSSHLVEGLRVDVERLDDGIEAEMFVQEGRVIPKQVHLCFGMLPKSGIQRIVMRVNIGADSKVSILAHCTFPNAVDVRHIMDACITVGRGAHYEYFERHVHGDEGGVKVLPKAVVTLEEAARFKTEFELLKGRVGLIDIDYETTCKARSVMEMTARINGFADDKIKINETGYLIGEYARGVLTTKIAVSDRARADVYNKLTASAPYATGHVDCKEVVREQAVANAVPIVEVNHPKAHVTHEAAIGSVDAKQMETLMARGLDEEEASDLIIQGMLS